MPPRYAYWTILAGGLPTAFRAAERDDLMPTFRRLQEKHPDAELKWFSRGRLWDSPEAARQEWAAEARRRDDAHPPRGKTWRPGGEHRDPRQPFIDAKKARNLDRRKQRFERSHARDERPSTAGGREPWRPSQEVRSSRPGQRPADKPAWNKRWQSPGPAGRSRQDRASGSSSPGSTVERPAAGRRPYTPKGVDSRREDRPFAPKAPGGERRPIRPAGGSDQRGSGPFRAKESRGDRDRGPFRPKGADGARDRESFRGPGPGGERTRKPYLPKGPGAERAKPRPFGKQPVRPGSGGPIGGIRDGKQEGRRPLPARKRFDRDGEHRVRDRKKR